jgi:hypothetical protein
MVGRLNDLAKFREADLRAYTMYPQFGVRASLLWLKNVAEERNVFPQVLLSLMGRRYDCIFNLRLWLEYHCNIN